MSRTPVKQPAAIASLFIWIGFVCAISFMEAWLKFRAPGVTLAIGLGIGKLVFAALNRVEWALAVIVCVSAFVYSRQLFTLPNLLLFITITILIMQTTWLLPALDLRAGHYIKQGPVVPSDLHLWFVGAEAIKVLVLFITAISLLKQSQDNGAGKHHRSH